MVLETGAGRAVTAGARLAGGGQGEVFAVVAPRGTVYKRYLPAALAADPALARRLPAMIGAPPAGWREHGSGHLNLAWPSDVVLDRGRFAGFLMPAVEFAKTVSLHRVTNPTDRRTATGQNAWARGFTWQYLVRTAANLAHATRLLHEAQVVIGDFNDANVRVWRNARVTLLDCDSMQVRDPDSGERFLCRVGRPEFTPPELAGADWAVTVRHPSSDLFALAVHVYQLLLEGEHPFRGVWHGAGEKPTVPELAGQGVWAHQAGGPLTARPAAIGADLIPPGIAGMFRRAFEDGATVPTARPSAVEWEDALNELSRSIRQCGSDAAHFFPVGLSSCPWCRNARRMAARARVPATARMPASARTLVPAGLPAYPPGAGPGRPPARGPRQVALHPATARATAVRPGGGWPQARRRGGHRRAALLAGALILALTATITGLVLNSGGRNSVLPPLPPTPTSAVTPPVNVTSPAAYHPAGSSAQPQQAATLTDSRTGVDAISYHQQTVSVWSIPRKDLG